MTPDALGAVLPGLGPVVAAASPLLGLALPPAQGIFQLGLVAAALILLGLPLGRFMAAVYAGRPTPLTRLLGPVERGICRLVGADPADEMTWDRYATATIAFSITSVLLTHALQRLQHLLPLNPAGLPAVSADSSLNTAVSFMTNTNWQGYAGEATMSHGTQLLALAVQNFASAAVGMAVLAAFVRGFTRANAGTIGNFWVDLVRGVVHVLLPLATVLAMLLVSQGVVQTFDRPARWRSSSRSRPPTAPRSRRSGSPSAPPPRRWPSSSSARTAAASSTRTPPTRSRIPPPSRTSSS